MYCFDNKFITFLHTLAIIPNLIYNVPTKFKEVQFK